MSLFDDDEVDNLSITVNERYAEKFSERKQREELTRLRDKYGKDADELEESESDSEEEDSDAELLTADVERDIFRTISLIKAKDPKIYQKDVEFFKEQLDGGDAEDGQEGEKPTNKKDKKVTLRDYERRELLEKGAEKAFGGDSDSDDNDDANAVGDRTYVEEQADLKSAFRDIDVGSDSESDSGGLFAVKIKTADESHKEEEDYLEWLKGQKDLEDKRLVHESETLKRFWQDPNLDDNEKFLRDYVLNRKWVDKDETRKGPGDDEPLTDEDDVERAEHFEKQYNFRYEEEGGAEIISYPRVIADSVRRTDDKRKDKRKERAERKKAEKEAKKQEIKRLKNLKSKEIMEKLKQIREITGNDDLEVDLDAEFDPEKYDQEMQQKFDDGYYAQADEEKPVFSDDDDLGIENWEDSDDDVMGDSHVDMDSEDGSEDVGAPVESSGDDGSKKKKKKKGKKGKTDDDEALYARNAEYYGGDDDLDFNMDADYAEDDGHYNGYDESLVQDAPDTQNLSKAQKKKQKKNMARFLKDAEGGKKPLFDQAKMSFDEYLGQYYNLDFEDLIGDMPVRFKYRHVEPVNYGLDTAEILLADDKELNQWVGLRKVTKYRPQTEQKKEARQYQNPKLQHKKKKVLQTIYGHKQQDSAPGKGKAVVPAGAGGSSNNWHKSKKEKKSGKEGDQDAERGLKRTAEDADAAPQDGSKKSKKKKKKNDKTRQQDDEIANDKEKDGQAGNWSRDEFNKAVVGDSRLAAYTSIQSVKDSKKKKKRQK